MQGRQDPLLCDTIWPFRRHPESSGPCCLGGGASVATLRHFETQGFQRLEETPLFITDFLVKRHRH
jgi:hypothetical protein